MMRRTAGRSLFGQVPCVSQATCPLGTQARSSRRLRYFLVGIIAFGPAAFAQRPAMTGNPAPQAASHFVDRSDSQVQVQAPARDAEHHVVQAPIAETKSSATQLRAETGSAASGAIGQGGFLSATTAVSAQGTLPAPAASKTEGINERPQEYPHKITVSFPSGPSSNLRVSSREGPTKNAVADGHENALRAETPQHGMAAPHAGGPVHAGAPIRSGSPPSAGSRVVSPSRPPVGGLRIAPPRRPGVARGSRPFWFLESPRGAAGPPHVFNPRRPPRFFDGLGFFGGPFGFPFFGFGFSPGCNAFWAWPWAYGCATYGYWNGYGPEIYGNYEPGYFESEEAPEMEQPPEPFESYQYVPPPEESSPEEIEAEKILFVLYLKDGSVYAVTNYWVADGKLHYKTSYGGEDTIDLNDLDLQKTVDVNAKRGVPFTLKSSPDQNPPNEPQPPPQEPEPFVPQP